MNIFELTRSLIDTPSVTGSELDVSNYLARYLESLGYAVEQQECAPGRSNILATTTSRAEVVFSTHLDTVPPFIASSEDDENIYGRGACDAKGIIATQIVAAERLRSSGITNIGLLFTVDEELASAGAQAANKHPRAAYCRYLINGEPTDNKLAIGTKGAMRLLLKTKGKAAHSAYPEAGDSAIEKLLDVLEDIRKIDWPGNPLFGETTCNIGLISGGTRPNVIPENASAELQIRLACDIESAKKAIDDAVKDRAAIEYASAHEPIKLHSASGFEECVVRFTTDIPYLSNWGQALLIGPGSILDAHTEHEKVSKRELEEAVDLYVDLAQRLLTKS
jgi:acetylornithine deacetylase